MLLQTLPQWQGWHQKLLPCGCGNLLNLLSVHPAWIAWCSVSATFPMRAQLCGTPATSLCLREAACLYSHFFNCLVLIGFVFYVSDILCGHLIYLWSNKHKKHVKCPSFPHQLVDYRVEFSKWWVNEFKTIKFPSQGTIFDYYIDSDTKKFMPWTDKVPAFELDPDVPLQVMGKTHFSSRSYFILIAFPLWCYKIETSAEENSCISSVSQ